jgi:hypothetical protein
MSRLMPFEGLIKNLRQEIPQSRPREYLTREQAYELLKKWSGQDFGMDDKRWESWAIENKKL